MKTGRQPIMIEVILMSAAKSVISAILSAMDVSSNMALHH